MKKYDIAVCYRVYPKIAKTPIICNDNKLNLVKLCMASVAEALREVNAKLIVLFDNCPQEYDDLFKQLLHGIDWEGIHLKGIGNYATFKMQCDILTQQNDSEIVMFLEDDYFLMKDSIKKTIAALQLPNVDFVTPFEHSDYYKLKLHNYKKETIPLDEKTTLMKVSSTTCTFATTKTTLLKEIEILLSYTKNNSDCALWMSMTKLNAFNAFIPVYYTLHGQYNYAYIYFKLFKYGWKRLLHKKRNLFCMTPSLATHMETPDVSITVDWQPEFQRVIHKLSQEESKP
jgi:hypothetical protein